MSGEMVKIYKGEDFDTSWRLFETGKNVYCLATGIEVKGQLVAGPDTEENIMKAFNKVSSEDTAFTCAIKLDPSFGCPPGYKDCKNGLCAPKNKKCTVFGCVNLLTSKTDD
jgi:hypothetical protein